MCAIFVGMQVDQYQIWKSTGRGIYRNIDSSVNYVAKVFTRMLIIKGTWGVITEERNTGVKPVGRNSQRRRNWYFTEKSMTQRETQNDFHVKHVGKAFYLETNSWNIRDPTEERPATSVISVARHWQVVCHCKHTSVPTQVRNLSCVMFVAKHLVLLNTWMFMSALTQVWNLTPAKNVASVLHSVHHCQFTCATTQGSDPTSVNFVARHSLPRRYWIRISRTIVQCWTVSHNSCQWGHTCTVAWASLILSHRFCRVYQLSQFTICIMFIVFSHLWQTNVDMWLQMYNTDLIFI